MLSLEMPHPIVKTCRFNVKVQYLAILLCELMTFSHDIDFKVSRVKEGNITKNAQNFIFNF